MGSRNNGEKYGEKLKKKNNKNQERTLQNFCNFCRNFANFTELWDSQESKLDKSWLSIHQSVEKCIKSIKLDKIWKSHRKKKHIKSFRIRELKIGPEIQADFWWISSMWDCLGDIFLERCSKELLQLGSLCPANYSLTVANYAIFTRPRDSFFFKVFPL